MKVIIIEDELASQEYIREILAQHFPGLLIVSVIDNVVEAIAEINKNQPHIVFMDVEIRLGTGFDVLKEVKSQAFEIIFTTAFDTFAVEAFRYHAIDYLLKPLDDLQVIEAIERCFKRIKSNEHINYQEKLLSLLQDPPVRKSRLSIPTLDGIEFVEFADIIYGEAKGNYTELKLKTGKSVTITRKLKEVEEALPIQQFFRVHNSYIVNIEHIMKYHRGRGGHVILHNGSSLPVSSARKDEFLDWLT